MRYRSFGTSACYRARSKTDLPHIATDGSNVKRAFQLVSFALCLTTGAFSPLVMTTGASAAVGCPQYAATVAASSAANVIDFNFTQGLSTPTDPSLMPYMTYAGQAPLVGTRLSVSGSHTYLTTAQVTLHYGSMTFAFSPHSFFQLSCAGEAKGAPLKPAVYLGAGQVFAADPSSFSGGVMTWEGLYGAVPGARGPLSFTVVRTTAKPITELLDLVNTSVRTNQSVRGTTTMRVSANNHVNVTPYVGTRIGSCRHARIASLNSIRNTSVFAGLV